MRTLLSKRPWESVMPSAPRTALQTEEVTQEDFIRQYYPSSHKIQDPMFYPDIWRQITEPVLDANGNDTGRTVVNTYVEKVPRFSFAYQQIITTNVNLFRDGWHEKDMEHAFFEFAKSVKITGDAAFVAYLEDGKFGWEVLSFLKGDSIYPHYGKDGKLAVFARSYKERTADGTVIERMEVWDKEFLYQLHKATSPNENPVTMTFGRGSSTCSLDGYVYDNPNVGPIAHGFKCVPVVYLRSEEGPCWAPSQDSIDEYEIAFSQMAHNNKAFGEPILYLKGDNVDANHDLNGTIKTITMGQDDNAGYLAGQSASDSFMKELSDLHERIFEQSFIVTPPNSRAETSPQPR